MATSNITDRQNGLLASLAIKAPCKTVSTAALTLYGEQTVAGVPVFEGDRVLLAITGGHVDNGIWVVSEGTWQRAKDFDGNRDFVKGTILLVAPGLAISQMWELITDDPEIGDALEFQAFTPDELALRADLAAPSGATLVGATDTYNWFDGDTLQELIDELANPYGQFRTDGVNVLHYILPAEWADILDGTSTTNLYAYLQAAHTAENALFYPVGLFLTDTKITTKVGGCVTFGSHRRGAELRNTAGGAFFELPVADTGAADNEFFNLYFTGANATGITADKTTGAGVLKGYAVRAHVHHCDFNRELSFGVDADLIYSVIEWNTFGYYQASANAAFVGIKSYQVGTNPSNVNTVRYNFFTGGNTTTGFALDVNGGNGWEIVRNGFEGGGQAIRMDNTAEVVIERNWFEALNCGAGRVIDLCPTGVASGNAMARMQNNDFSGNTCTEVIRWESIMSRCIVRENNFVLAGSSYAMTDGQTGSHLLDGAGKLQWFDNTVSGGNAANRLRTTTRSDYVEMLVNTASPGSILKSDDEDATIAFTSTGNVTVTLAHPHSTSASYAFATANGQETWVKVGAAANTTFTFRAINSAGAAQNDVLHVHIRRGLG